MSVAAPPREIPAAWNHGALILAFAGLALLIASLTIFKMSNNDIWIHLKTGENVLKTWSVPDKDPYSFTASDHDYVAHEWLSGVLFYLVYAAGGVNGLIFFKSAIIFATCAALWGACRFRRDDPLIVFPCFCLMLFIGSARFLERPHIFSYLFEALYLLCYFGYREGGRDVRWLYAIPVLHILWTNLHGGHYQGIFMLVMLAAAEAIMYVRAHRFGLATTDAIPPRDLAIVTALPFACLVTALVNPYGYRLLTFPFELTGQEIFMRGIYEWQSALYTSYNLSSMFLYYVLWIAVLFGSFLLVRGHRELRGGLKDAALVANLLLGVVWVAFVYQLAGVYCNPAVPSAIERQAPFWYCMVGVFLLANLHRLQFHHAGIVALFFAISLRHNRGVTDAAVATLPSLSNNLNQVLGRFPQWKRAGPPWLRPVALAMMGAVMLWLGYFTFTHSYYFGFRPPSKRDMGLGIAENMPVGAVDYIARNEITGNGFPSYNAGALLLNRMWPRVKVAMDSRNDVYGETLYREYVGALAGGTALEAYLRKYPVDFFLITYGNDRSPEFFRWLDASPDWRLVYFDDRAIVYLRNNARFQRIIARDAYDLIHPAVAGARAIRTEDAPRWLVEAERAVAAAPREWSPLQYKAKALLALDRIDEAEAANEALLRLNPAAYFAWADLGIIYMVKNRPADAERAFIECLRIQPEFTPCQEYLSRLKNPR